MDSELLRDLMNNIFSFCKTVHISYNRALFLVRFKNPELFVLVEFNEENYHKHCRKYLSNKFMVNFSHFSYITFEIANCSYFKGSYFDIVNNFSFLALEKLKVNKKTKAYVIYKSIGCIFDNDEEMIKKSFASYYKANTKNDL